MIDFILPELGENIASGDVLRVLVKAGDTLAKEQPVVELETDKATIEVPSSVAGRVSEVKVKPGDKVKVGQVLLSVEEAAPAAAPPSADAAGPVPPSSAAALPPPAGGGPSEMPPAAGAAPAGDDEGSADPNEKAGATRRRNKVVDIGRGSRSAAAVEPPATEGPAAPAAPSVRRLARELGVDVSQVKGSGPNGRLSIDDVKGHAKRLVSEAAQGGGRVAAEPLPDFTRWGEIERQPMRAVRRKTAEHLSAAWAAVVHVTQHDLADITTLDELRRRYSKQVEAAGGHLTMTAIAVKIVAAALKVFPQFNASIDVAAGEIIVKKYINIGVAVDTDRGLLVPVIPAADEKNIIQISTELVQLSEKARTHKISLDEMRGGTFSVSNLGGIGGTFFTPIVNLPEVAILGISRGRMEPVFSKESGGFTPRLMLPLSLSYDHRVIDGADGARFLRWVAEAFEQPFVLALEG